MSRDIVEFDIEITPKAPPSPPPPMCPEWAKSPFMLRVLEQIAGHGSFATFSCFASALGVVGYASRFP